MKFEEKCIALLRLDIKLSAIKGVIDDLSKNKKALEEAYENVKFSIISEMQEDGVLNCDLHGYRFSLRKTPAVAIVLDEGSIPQEFFVIKKQLDKRKLNQVIKDGTNVPGAEAGKEGTTLIVNAA